MPAYLLLTGEVTQCVVCKDMFGLSTPCGMKQRKIEKTQKHESDFKCMIQHIHLYFFHPFLIPKHKHFTCVVFCQFLKPFYLILVVILTILVQN